MHAIAADHELLVENLRTAFDRESNKRLRYIEFAEKADREGWHGVASLLRAASCAANIHAANHARILHQVDGTVECAPQSVEAMTTFENVRSALDGEIFEIDTMYPAFIDEARAARDVAAVRTFTWALQAEKTHARLFNEALALLETDDEESWVMMARDFYVCPVCGYTSEDAYEAEMCPACYCAWSRFEKSR